MKAFEHERRDWVIIVLILLFGLFCMLLAGEWALRFTPRWELDTNMESNLDPNSDFLTRRPSGFIEPVDAAILTNPAWINVFLTPGASFTTGTPFPITSSTFLVTRTATSPPVVSSTGTFIITPSPTRTQIFILPPSSTPNPGGPTQTRTSLSAATSTFTSTNTQIATFTPTFTPTPTFTITNTPVPSADLQITKSDGATDYFSNSARVYTIVVSNPVGPSNINGATVTDAFPAQISSANWTCAGAGGAVCTANGSGNINDLVNLLVGSFVTYTVNVTIIAGASGDMTNTASVSLPVGYTDPVPGNNTATDTDQLIQSSTFPNGNIGNTQDGSITTLSPGSSITLTFGTPVVVGSHSGYDLVYYELSSGTGILIDNVILQLSDGYNWYTIFNWGDNNADTNSNLNINVIGGAETDNRDFSTSPASDILYNSTGVLIDLDGVAPNGTYLFIRIVSPTGEDGDGSDVDGIEVLP